MTRRNLIIIHRGPEYERDFDEIAAAVNALDPSITIYHLSAGLKAELRVGDWQYPTLTVALVSDFRLPIRRGKVLRCAAIQKPTQQAVFRENGISTPPSAIFRFGTKLDPIVFGDFVLLKPLNLKLTSHGHGIHVMRRGRAESIAPAAFSEDHPIRNGEQFVIQKFVYTGKFATTYRVTTFLGAILFAARFEADSPSPDLSAPDHVLDAGKFTHKGNFSVTFVNDEEILALARKVAVAFEDAPLLGIDIVRDERSSRLYVLEVNAGGNTWHFSSEMWADRRRKMPDVALAMKTQFSAFDVAARALVDKVQLLAD